MAINSLEDLMTQYEASSDGRELIAACQAALDNRRIVHIVPGTNAAKEDIDRAQQIVDTAKSNGLTDPDSVINYISAPTAPSEVLVGQSHLYPLLLGIALVSIVDRFGGIGLEEIRAYMSDAAAHELAHFRPIINEPGVSVQFGVDFQEDELTGGIGIRPFMRMAGRMTLAKSREVDAAPGNDSSTTDLIDQQM